MESVALLCCACTYTSQIADTVTCKSEYFQVPGLPDHIEVTKEQLPEAMHQNLQIMHEQLMAAESVTYGIIYNSFEELEPAYVQEFKEARGDKVWCIGPVSLATKMTWISSKEAISPQLMDTNASSGLILKNQTLYYMFVLVAFAI